MGWQVAAPMLTNNADRTLLVRDLQGDYRGTDPLGDNERAVFIRLG